MSVPWFTVYADLYSFNCHHTVISLLAQCFEILRRTCWSSSNLNIFIRYSYSLESVLIKRPLHFIGTKQ